VWQVTFQAMPNYTTHVSLQTSKFAHFACCYEQQYWEHYMADASFDGPSHQQVLSLTVAFKAPGPEQPSDNLQPS